MLIYVWFGGLHAVVKEILSKLHFQARLQNCEERLFASSCLACPSVRPHGTTRLSLYGFSWYLIFGCFRKSVEKIQASLKSDKNNGYLNPLNAKLNPIYPLLALLGAHHILHVSRIKVKWRPMYIFLSHVPHFFLKLEMCKTNLKRNSKHILCSMKVFFFPKIVPVWDNLFLYLFIYCNWVVTRWQWLFYV